MIAVRPRSLDGTIRIQTRNEMLHLEDGVVQLVTSLESHEPLTSALVGMRIVGWAGDDDRLHPEFLPGTRAVLWRKDQESEETALALTGRVFELAVVRKSVTGSLTLPARSGSASRPGDRHSGVHRASRA